MNSFGWLVERFRRALKMWQQEREKSMFKRGVLQRGAKMTKKKWRLRQQKQSQEQRAIVLRLRQQWLGQWVRFTVPGRGVGLGIVSSISDDGDVVVSHPDYQTTGLPEALRCSMDGFGKYIQLLDA